MSIDSRHIVEQRSRAERTANAEVIPVPDPAPDAAYAGTESEESDAAGLPLVPLQPFLVRRSGIYRIEQPVLQPTVPQPIPVPTPHIPIPPIDLPVGPRPRTQASGNGNGTAMHAGSRRGRFAAPPAAPDHTAVRLRGAAGRCRRHQAHDDRERHDHPPVRRPAHLDRSSHEGPGDRCVDRTDQLSRRQYDAATAGLGRGAAHRRSVPPGEPEGDRHVQRRHRQPTHAHLQLRAGCLPRGGLRVRHGQ